MLSPRHRFEALLAAVKANTPPPSGVELEVYQAMTQTTFVATDSTYAFDLYKVEEHRSVLDAFILSGADFDTINRVLDIPVKAAAAYQFLFFDPTSFRNRLEKISYASNYPGTAYARELLRTGVMVGVGYLIWTYGGRDEVDTRQVVRHTMVDAYFRGMAHKGNSLTSGVAKESQKWWTTAIRNAEILEKMDPRASKHAYEELRIALEAKDETTPAEKAPVPLDQILH